MKRILALFTLALLCVGMSAQVAKIGEVTYATLQEAVDAAGNGDLITVLPESGVDEHTAITVSGKVVRIQYTTIERAKIYPRDMDGINAEGAAVWTKVKSGAGQHDIYVGTIVCGDFEKVLDYMYYLNDVVKTPFHNCSYFLLKDVTLSGNHYDPSMGLEQGHYYLSTNVGGGTSSTIRAELETYLDLNGCTIEQANTRSGRDGYALLAVQNGAQFTLKDTSAEGNGKLIGTLYGMTVDDTSVFTMQGGTLITKGQVTAAYANEPTWPLIIGQRTEAKNSNVILDGGNIVGDMRYPEREDGNIYPIYCYSGNNITVTENMGSITGAPFICGTMTVAGGEWEDLYAVNGGVVTITGGTFEDIHDYNGSGKIIVLGGSYAKYASDTEYNYPENYLADGYMSIDNGDDFIIGRRVSYENKANAGWFMSVDTNGNDMFALNSKTIASVWVLLPNHDADNSYSLYSPYYKKYAADVPTTKNTAVSLTDGTGVAKGKYIVTTDTDGYTVLHSTTSYVENNVDLNCLHQATGAYNRIVRWGANADASKWVESAVTDEEYLEMYIATIDLTNYHFAPGLGNYHYVIDGEIYYNDIEIEIGFCERISEIDEIINSIAINQPEAGKFYRFRNFGMANRTTNPIDRYYNGTWVGEKETNGTVFYYDGTRLLQYNNGYYVNGARVASSVVDEPETYIFTEARSTYGIASNGAKADYGTYCIHGSKMTGTITVWENQSKGAMDINSDNWGAWYIEDVEELPFSISATAEYASFASPVEVTMPEGITVYYASGVDANGELTLTEITSRIVPANEGVLLYKQGGATGNAKITTTGASISGNVLSYTINAINDYTYGPSYALGYKNSKTAFYRLKENSYIPGFRAYLVNNENAASEMFCFVLVDDDLTGVDNIEDATKTCAPYYNLQGHAVANPAKGNVYIQNGKVIRY